MGFLKDRIPQELGDMYLSAKLFFVDGKIETDPLQVKWFTGYTAWRHLKDVCLASDSLEIMSGSSVL